jgi:hypothetical protein
MSEAWKELDLGGGGLQQANLRLARLLRRRGVACALLLAFPLGLHRDYLHDRRGAWLFRLATASSIAAMLAGGLVPGGLIALGLVIAAAIDLARVDARVAAVNRRLRMQVYMSQTEGAPRGFRGHYTDEPQAGSAGSGDDASHAAERPASFAEQEKMLRHLAQARGKRPQ